MNSEKLIIEDRLKGKYKECIKELSYLRKKKGLVFLISKEDPLDYQSNLVLMDNEGKNKYILDTFFKSRCVTNKVPNIYSEVEDFCEEIISSIEKMKEANGYTPCDYAYISDVLGVEHLTSDTYEIKGVFWFYKDFHPDWGK